MVTVERPRFASDHLNGAFAVSPALLKGVQSAAAGYLGESKARFTLEMRDGTKLSVSSVDELDELAIGDRREVRHFEICIDELERNYADPSSVTAKFDIEPYYTDVIVHASGRAHAAELCRTVKSVIEGHRVWYSPIYSKYAGWANFIGFGLFGAAVTRALRSEANLYTTYWMALIALFLILLPTAKGALFDRLIFDFGSGALRERNRRAARRTLAASFSLLAGALVWLQQPVVEALSSRLASLN